MDNVDVVRDAKPMPQAGIDPDVKIPESVRRAAAAADAFYQQPQPQPEPQPQLQTPQPEPQPQPQLQTPQPEPQPQPQPGQWQEGDRPPGDPAAWSDWEKRYNSMKGRYDQSQQQITHLQEQVSAMGDELMRTQQVMQSLAPATQTPQQIQRHLTPEDEASLGTEVISSVQRAALDAVAPQLSKLENENQDLKKQLRTNTQRGLVQQLDATFGPRGFNWREINKSPAFKRWLSLPDVYSSQVRGKLMEVAIQAADAPRVANFFNGFIRDAQVAGQMPTPQPEPQPASGQPAPQRQAAIALDTLAAPGRAHPATGDSNQVPTEKPIFTRAQISKFYSQDGRKAYVGREADRAADEQLIFAAQKDGRVRG